MAPANGDITTQVALLNQRVGDLIAKLDELEKDLRDLHEMASRWKGGFLVIVGLGGVIGWIASIWDKVTRPWH